MHFGARLCWTQNLWEPQATESRALWYRVKYEGPYSGVYKKEKRINCLINKLQHKTDHLPPMWWPVQICFHPLHPHRLALHQELNNRDLVHTSINILGFKNVHKKSLESSKSSIIVSHVLVTVCGFQNFNLIRMNSLRGTCDGLLSPYLHPQSWFWLTQGWALRLPHCFWPRPETHTPPRHWGPLQWLSLCYHQLSQALRKKKKQTSF